MAIKFTKAQVAEWREHIDNIRSAHDDLTEAVQRYNDVMRAEREKVEPPEVEFPDELEEPSDDYIEEMDNLATQPKE